MAYTRLVSTLAGPIYKKWLSSEGYVDHAWATTVDHCIPASEGQQELDNVLQWAVPQKLHNLMPTADSRLRGQTPRFSSLCIRIQREVLLLQIPKHNWSTTDVWPTFRKWLAAESPLPEAEWDRERITVVKS